MSFKGFPRSSRLREFPKSQPGIKVDHVGDPKYIFQCVCPRLKERQGPGGNREHTRERIKREHTAETKRGENGVLKNRKSKTIEDKR